MTSLILARGILAPHALPGPVVPGAASLALPGADLLFTPGDLLFIGEPDPAPETGAASAEFLGAVSAVDASSIAFTLPALAARPAGALLWSPLAEYRSAGRLDAPPRRVFETGAHVQRTLGGRVVAVRTAEPAARLDLVIAGLTPREEQSLLDWIRDDTDAGLHPFTLVTPARELFAIHLDAGRIERRAAEGGRRSLAFAAFDLGEGRYA